MTGENRPKRPKNGYFLYRDTVYADCRKRHPEKSITELAKLIAEEYKGLPEQKRGKFEKEYKEAMVVYRKDKEEYDARVQQAQRAQPKKGEEKSERARSKSRKPGEKKAEVAARASPEKRGRRKKE